ncbi:MAG: response regulator [Planctomycetota bacterium]|nr:MAG: response regulator [Planctomycetota bacterium]
MPKKVLVVDDSAMMRKIVVKNIREAGFDVSVVEASDGKEGLEKFQAEAFDAVLTDWNMPNMDGVTMVKEIRKIDPNKKVPIVMVTTEGSADKVKEAVLAGANNYIAKPFTADRLREKLGKILG